MQLDVVGVGGEPVADLPHQPRSAAASGELLGRFPDGVLLGGDSKRFSPRLFATEARGPRRGT
ncbi:hypothetical protein SRB17_83300 [Streptomyces sp. RB17]|uniref:hypothetical protein n=1 Tax=Streptomyces sp. RB17 TaxID=2585197 RepID=UPI00130AE109|nr:hypothetical protein [Streptomyces sp. RB17]MQY40297.1 hypothetical protein [Streptomyces sp. RB17]